MGLNRSVFVEAPLLQPLTTSVRWQSTRVETLVWCAQVIRPMYSNPPRHGAAIVATILGDPRLYEQWKVELKGMADRIITMREKLHQALVDQGAPGDWSFILKQIGMFSFTGLTKVDCSDGNRLRTQSTVWLNVHMASAEVGCCCLVVLAMLEHIAFKFGR